MVGSKLPVVPQLLDLEVMRVEQKDSCASLVVLIPGLELAAFWVAQEEKLGNLTGDTCHHLEPMMEYGMMTLWETLAWAASELRGMRCPWVEGEEMQSIWGKDNASISLSNHAMPICEWISFAKKKCKRVSQVPLQMQSNTNLLLQPHDWRVPLPRNNLLGLLSLHVSLKPEGLLAIVLEVSKTTACFCLKYFFLLSD